MIKISYIRKLPNGKYRVFSEKGKNLGTYDSKSDAEKRLKQIETFKHMKKASVDKVDLTDIEEFRFSSVCRKLREKVSEKLFMNFLTMYKKHFDFAIKNGFQKPEILALTKALIDFNKIKKIKIKKELIKSAAITELGNSEQVGQYLANIIRFILQRISEKNRTNAINKLKTKIYQLNEGEIANKNMPASSAMGQAITLVKHILFNHDPIYIRSVINNVVRYL